VYPFSFCAKIFLVDRYLVEKVLRRKAACHTGPKYRTCEKLAASLAPERESVCPSRAGRAPLFRCAERLLPQQELDKNLATESNHSYLSPRPRESSASAGRARATARGPRCSSNAGDGLVCLPSFGRVRRDRFSVAQLSSESQTGLPPLGSPQLRSLSLSAFGEDEPGETQVSAERYSKSGLTSRLRGARERLQLCKIYVFLFYLSAASMKSYGYGSVG
jgi:hypothetical protein